MNIELITWIDAESQAAGWRDLEESRISAAKELPTVLSVGFVIFDGKNHLTLMHSDGGDEHIHAIKIPKRWIIKRQILRRGKGIKK